MLTPTQLFGQPLQPLIALVMVMASVLDSASALALASIAL